MKVAQRYYYVEPFKEQEINLFLKSDSTFSFQDASGCNQFEFTGIYKMANEGESDNLFSIQFSYESCCLTLSKM